MVDMKRWCECVPLRKRLPLLRRRSFAPRNTLHRERTGAAALACECRRSYRDRRRPITIVCRGKGLFLYFWGLRGRARV
jgi:hypothetical protein